MNHSPLDRGTLVDTSVRTFCQNSKSNCRNICTYTIKVSRDSKRKKAGKVNKKKVLFHVTMQRTQPQFVGGTTRTEKTRVSVQWKLCEFVTIEKQRNNLKNKQVKEECTEDKTNKEEIETGRRKCRFPIQRDNFCAAPISLLRPISAFWVLEYRTNADDYK